MMNNKLTDELLAFESDHIWVNENRERLLKQYADQWIAVRNRQVIDSDPEFVALISRLADSTHICVEFITSESLEMVL
jgi:hypothetical protein